MIVDLTQVRHLAEDLDRHADWEVVSTVKAVVVRGALNVKRDAVQLISGHPRSRHYPQSISYEVEVDAARVSAEIGPDKSRTQGALGNILEYGTSKNAPLPHLGPALLAEEPRYVKALADEVARSLL